MPQEDGDVHMDLASQRGPRRRKKRNKDGGLSVQEDVDMEDVEMKDEVTYVQTLYYFT